MEGSRATDRSVSIWLDPSQASLAATICGEASLEVIGVGSAAARSAAASDFNALGEHTIFNDLRTLAETTTPAVLLVLSAAGAEGDSPLDDRGTIDAVTGKAGLVASIEPVADPRVHWLGGLRETRAFAELRAANADETADTIGRVRGASVISMGRREVGSLHARLFDAFTVVLELLGEPARIDASCAARSGNRPRHLMGALSAHLRYAEPAGVSVFAADEGHAWRRELTIVGEKGSVRMTDHGFDRLAPDGSLVDTDAPTADTPIDPAAALAHSLARLLDRHAPRPDPIDLDAAFALVEAASLSVRTGQAEWMETGRKLIKGV